MRKAEVVKDVAHYSTGKQQKKGKRALKHTPDREQRETRQR